MFDFIRKPLVWKLWDEGLGDEIGGRSTFQLKTVQDLAVYGHLHQATGQTIAEIGAGHSRVLPRLAENNSCTMVEKFEGQGGGPTSRKDARGVQAVSAYLGEMSPELEDDSFDALYSISVVEHVPDEKGLAAFHTDQLRILKPGGLFVHAIDIYVDDTPEPFHVSRFERYRDWLSSADVEPVGDIYDGPLRFSCDFATNPDDVMYIWGRSAPSLIDLRQRAQCVSVLVAGRKLGAISTSAQSR